MGVHGQPPPSCDVRRSAHDRCLPEHSNSQTDFTSGALTFRARLAVVAPERQQHVTSACHKRPLCSLLRPAASSQVPRRTHSGPLTGLRHPPIRLYNVHIVKRASRASRLTRFLPPRAPRPRPLTPPGSTLIPYILGTNLARRRSPDLAERWTARSPCGGPPRWAPLAERAG